MAFDLQGIKSFTRFWALLMFGSYSVINIIVLLNMLIAMMSNSYQIISEKSDSEWKFARSHLWISYFDDGNTLPPPFNLFPTVKIIYNMMASSKRTTKSIIVSILLPWFNLLGKSFTPPRAIDLPFGRGGRIFCIFSQDFTKIMLQIYSKNFFKYNKK